MVLLDIKKGHGPFFLTKPDDLLLLSLNDSAFAALWRNAAAIMCEFRCNVQRSKQFRRH
jgi:hypothetical protein